MEQLLDSKPYRGAMIGVFLALSFAPLLLGAIGVGNDVAEIELRTPAEFPSLSLAPDAILLFPAALDAYLDDTFGFRSQLVTANSLLHLAFGVSGSQRYIVGRDGWFFHREVDNVLEQARGTETFTSPELVAWIDEMERRQRWLERQGIEFLIVIAPSKHAIYPEFLPTWVNKVGPTRYQQLRRALSESKLEVLDLHAPLRAAKSAGEPLYFKADDHWNAIGAFVAYREIAMWIKARHPEVQPLERDDLDLRFEEGAFGTITRGLNILEFVTEPIPELEPRVGSRVLSTELLGSGTAFSTTFVSRLRSDRTGGKKVLFVRDSFGEPLGHYVAETVTETILSHHRNGQFDRRFIREHKPDLVIYEMVERGLRWTLQPTFR